MVRSAVLGLAHGSCSLALATAGDRRRSFTPPGLLGTCFGMAQGSADSSRGHTVVAAFDDLQAARDAIVALERSSTEAGSIKLLHKGEDDANVSGSTARRRDVRATSAVGRNALKGLPIGAVVGAAIAMLAGYLISDDFGGSDIIGALLGGALLGGALGALFSAFAKLPASSEDWEKTFDDDTAGEVFVRVRSTDPSVVASAAEVLVDLRPKSVRRFDPSGKQV